METVAANVYFPHKEVSVNSNAMLVVKGCVRNLNVAGLLLPGQKTLRQRRALIGKDILCRDDCKIPFLAALCDEFLCGVSGNYSSAKDNDRKGLHGCIAL